MKGLVARSKRLWTSFSYIYTCVNCFIVKILNIINYLPRCSYHLLQFNDEDLNNGLIQYFDHRLVFNSQTVCYSDNHLNSRQKVFIFISPLNSTTIFQQQWPSLSLCYYLITRLVFVHNLNFILIECTDTILSYYLAYDNLPQKCKTNVLVTILIYKNFQNICDRIK